MMYNNRLFVMLFTTVLIAAPIVTTFLIVLNPMTEAQLDVVEESPDILSKLKEEGIVFDDTSLSPEDVEIPFGGFVQNLGQIGDESIKYYYTSDSGFVGFGDSKIDFARSGPHEEIVRFSIAFPSSYDVVPAGVEKKEHVVNYIKSKFQLSNIPTFNEIFYYNLYEKIDLRYYMTGEGLKYEFIVKPGADPSQISIEVSDAINLEIEEKAVSFFSSNELLFQDTGLLIFENGGTIIDSHFVKKTQFSNIYGFEVGNYDTSGELIIDPLFIEFSTFFGGSGYDHFSCIAVDENGSCYLGGFTRSEDIPLQNEYQSWQGNYSDGLVVKLDSEGELVFSTYLGGEESDSYNNGDSVSGIYVDDDGYVYVCGHTIADDFPLKNAFQDTKHALSAGFVSMLNYTGSDLIFSTFLDGTFADAASDIVLCPDGCVAVTGYTRSTDFPMKNAYNDTHNGDLDYDVFVTKFNSTYNGLNFSTFLGGINDDKSYGISTDSSGNIYITGETHSVNFPVSNAFDDKFNGTTDAFAAKLNPNTASLLYSSFLGGESLEIGYQIVVDSEGDAYVTGYTYSDDFTIVNGFDSTLNGSNDAFVVKIDTDGDTIHYSSYLGGDDNDVGLGITLGPNGHPYIVGYTESTDFPTKKEYNSTFGGVTDVFVTELNDDGDELVASTYIGGSALEYGYGIAVSDDGYIYVSGQTMSENYPTVNAYDSNHNGGGPDGFVTKLVLDEAPMIALNSPIEGSTIRHGMTIDIDVTDDWLVDTIQYRWDNGDNITLSEPYDIPVPSERTWTLHVFVNDSKGHKVSETYTFVRSTSLLAFSTYLGGSDYDYGMAVVLDDEGNSYVVGRTESSDFPTQNAMNETHGGNYDIFLSKFSLNGTLIYSTYIGGPGHDYASDIAIDSSGNLYLCGYTYSATGFPLKNAYNSTHSGGYDAFIMKLNNAGNQLLFSTYLGGIADDYANAIEVDDENNVFIVGYTYSTDFPNVSGYSNEMATSPDVFLSQLIPEGNELLYSTFLGGNGLDYGFDLALDSDGYCYIVGQTTSDDFPTQNAMNSSQMSIFDMFVTKMKPGEPNLNYSTYLGTSYDDAGRGVIVDASGVCYIVGWASGSGYPLKNEIQTYQGNRDIVVTAIDSTGTSILFSTYLGTPEGEEGRDIALGPGGHVHIIGYTSADGLPVENAYASTFAGTNDIVVAKFSLDGDQLEFCSYLGGFASDFGTGIAVHSDSSMFVTGYAISTDFPIVNAFQETHSGVANRDAIITRIAFDEIQPTIDDPPDTYYQIGTTGNNLTWTPQDDFPDHYQVFRNGSLIEEDDWDLDDENITISIDGLPAGVYNFTIVIWDDGGNNATHTIWVTVVNDTTPPTIDSPDNISYTEGSTGNEIVWNPDDDFPVSYTLYRNNTEIETGEWREGSITISIDGLGVGTYYYTITVFDVGGNNVSDTVRVRVFDNTWPVIDSPSDFSYAEGSTGNSLTWTPSDLHPSSYTVYRNGTELESDDWTGGTITITVDGLSLGIYNYTIIVLDESDNWQKDTVMVTVYDGTPPTIDSPTDIEYEEGQTGNSITWIPNDSHPYIYRIFINGTNIFVLGLDYQPWDGGTISVSIDGLSLGLYNYTIVVYDIGGNVAVDTVMVTITPASITTTTSTTTTTTTTTDGVDIIIIIAIVGAGGAILIIIIYVCKKKSS